MQVVDTPYALTMKVLLDKLSQGIHHGTDFDGVSVMMDFFTEGKKDDDKFKGLAKEIKLVDICQPSYRFMYQNWQPQEKKRAKWNFVENRLLTGENLARAVSLRLGGILFGLDRKGNPMIADGGVNPVYLADTYRRTWELMNKNGYGFFDDRENWCFDDLDKEIPKFERFTGEPFVRPLSGDTSEVHVWNDAGISYYGPWPQNPACCSTYNSNGMTGGERGEIDYPHPEYGIRRLFRAKA